jgi:hypothetical protein
MRESVTFFQPDGATAHTENNSVHYLQCDFNERIISRGLRLLFSSGQYH